DERLAEVPAEGVRVPVDVLQGHRLVEAVVVKQLLVVGFREIPDAERKKPDRIAWRKTRDRERDDRDADERGDRIYESSDDEVAQRSSIGGGKRPKAPPSTSDRYCLIHHW